MTPYTHWDSSFAAVRIAMALAAGLGLGACSMSFKVFGGDKKEEPATTASLPPAQAAPVTEVTALPLATSSDPASPSVMMPGAVSIGLSPSDWLYARGALGLALTGTEDGPPVLWANPETGARGSFRPASPTEARDGITCRRFLATRIAREREDTIEGRACQTPAGQWDVAEARGSGALTAGATL